MIWTNLYVYENYVLTRAWKEPLLKSHYFKWLLVLVILSCADFLRCRSHWDRRHLFPRKCIYRVGNWPTSQGSLQQVPLLQPQLELKLFLQMRNLPLQTWLESAMCKFSFAFPAWMQGKARATKEERGMYLKLVGVSAPFLYKITGLGHLHFFLSFLHFPV